MVVDLPRQWRWAIGAACVLAGALSLLFTILGRQADATLPAVVAGAAPAAAAKPSIPSSSPSLAAIGPAASDAHASDEIQVCGGAWVKTRADGSLDAAEFARATRMPQARERILANLRSNPGELAHAATLLLAMIGDDEQHRRAALGVPPNCEAAECQVSSQATADVALARDALARLAVSTTDPKVYALAFKVCSARRGEGACQLISAEQWARLDPGNASPWLSILAAAKARNDRTAQDEALFRIASAQRSDRAFFAVAGAILGATPDDDSSTLASLTMVTEAIGMEAAVGMPTYQNLTAACRRDALRDSNRAQTCAAIADVLAEHSDTLIERSIGSAIGRQVGWPAERSDRMRGEYEAYTASLTPAPSVERDFGCAPIRRELDLVRRRAALGETGALRNWIAKSGKNAEDFVRERRARQQAEEVAAAQYRREQAASAAAASAATASLR